MIKTMTNEIIDDVLFGGKTFMIFFYSDKMQNLDNVMKIFEGFNTQLSGKIDVYKCAIDVETGKLSKYFGMNVLPGMVIMKNNKPYANIAGPVSAMEYENTIKDAIVKIMQADKVIEESQKTFGGYSGGYKTIKRE